MNTQQNTYAAFIESVCAKFNCPEMVPALKEGFQVFCEASETISGTLKGAAAEKVNSLASRIISEYQPGDDLCKVGRYITDVLRQKISENKYAGIFPFECYVVQLIGFDKNILQHFIDMMNECGIRSSILHETLKGYILAYDFHDETDEQKIT